jgi:hypothetical protein
MDSGLVQPAGGVFPFRAGFHLGDGVGVVPQRRVCRVQASNFTTDMHGPDLLSTGKKNLDQ